MEIVKPFRCKCGIHKWEKSNVIHNKRTLYKIRFCPLCEQFEVLRNGSTGNNKWYSFETVFIGVNWGDTMGMDFLEALDGFIDKYKTQPYDHY